MPESALKKGWTRVAFGDVVQRSKERSSDPAGDGFEFYIGLEHIDTGDLKAQRRGDITDGTTFTTVFHPGQVMFGKRRAYQRKVALADFSGVCSGDIYVLEPKNTKLLPELLPFICQSDAFFEHAVRTSAGSLSPRTNWDSLASYEFALPPIESQIPISRALWAADAQWRACKQLVDRVRLSRKSLATLLFAEMSAGEDGQRLGDFVIESAYGPRFPGNLYVDNGNAWTVRTTDFAPDGGINFESVPSARLDGTLVATHRLRNGDFLLSRSGEYAGMVRVFDATAATAAKVFIPAAFLIRFRLDEERLMPQFLFEYFESPDGVSLVRSVARGSAQPNISGTAFMNLEVPVPRVEEQIRVCEILHNVRSVESLSAVRAFASTRLAARLSKTLLAPERS